MKDMKVEITTNMDVADTLATHSIPLSSIQATIWLHWHFDHIGDPSRFLPLTKIIVSSGFRKNLLPAYPANPVLESAFKDAPSTKSDVTLRSKLGVSELWIGFKTVASTC